VSAPMRILHVYPKDDTFTGAAIQLFELVGALKARGHEVVLATRPSPQWEARTRAAGIPWYPVAMRSEIDARSALRLAKIIRRHRIQVVHAQKGRARTLALMAGLLVKIPVLILNRGVSFPLDPFNRLGYTIKRVTGIVAVCESIKRGLVQMGVPGDKIEVIYSGTDTDRFHPGVDGAAIRRELGLAAGDFLVTQIGVRSIDPLEEERIREKRLRVYRMSEVRRRGMASVIAEALEPVRRAGGHLHVSLDIDFLDPAVAPGVGLAEPDGPDFRDAALCLSAVQATGLLGSFDLLELSPSHDPSGGTTTRVIDLVARAFAAQEPAAQVA